MTDQNNAERARWLTPSRLIGFAVFGLALLHPLTRLFALGDGFGWVLVECWRGANRATRPKDDDKGEG